ncbi:MAG TPA: hypothetical protein VFO59_02485, partial [Dehalococcoidia bacterium]|nr:hypothetical protein [Dehalococcoidia bacterium]
MRIRALALPAILLALLVVLTVALQGTSPISGGWDVRGALAAPGDADDDGIPDKFDTEGPPGNTNGMFRRDD